MASEKLVNVVIDGEEWMPRRLAGADRRTPLLPGDAAVVVVNGDKWIVPNEIATAIDGLRRIREAACEVVNNGSLLRAALPPDGEEKIRALRALLYPVPSAGPASEAVPEEPKPNPLARFDVLAEYD